MVSIDATCHEVDVCYMKLFRIVRDFRRYAETYTDESERKNSYMQATSEELSVTSDKLLSIALNRTKKRTWDEVELDSDDLE